MPRAPQVELLTRDGCTLCAEAERTVERYCAERGIDYALVDVDTDETLRREFTDHVPVLKVDGEVRSYWFVDEETLARWV